MTVPPISGSLLVITPLSPDTGLILPPYSARGLTQSLQPIGGPGGGGGSAEGTFIRESINGELINMFPEQFKKYQSTISCTDVRTPCLDPAYLGQTVLVDCCCELSYPLGGTPQRPVVSGSDREENHFIFYRPQLTMMVTGFGIGGFDEWAAAYAWQINLREVRNPNI